MQAILLSTRFRNEVTCGPDAPGPRLARWLRAGDAARRLDAVGRGALPGRHAESQSRSTAGRPCIFDFEAIVPRRGGAGASSSSQLARMESEEDMIDRTKPVRDVRWRTGAAVLVVGVFFLVLFAVAGGMSESNL